MALARAFTKRSKRPEVSAPMPYRESHKHAGPINRDKISAPVELLSTTNMLAYNAPDIHSATSSSTSSLQSPDDSEMSFTQRSFGSPLTTPDESPIEPNPLPSYFPKRSATVTSHPRSSTSTNSSTDAPLVPKRALSHTKRTHQELARQRSLSRLSPPPLNSLRNASAARQTQDSYKAEPHPFSKELEQVNEVVEEFGGTRILDDEELILRDKGLMKFTADDYLVEIEAFYGSVFDDYLGPIGTGAWL
ncbi:hypothetical protein CBS63078_8768 [Aspergillus niger]|uniref:uncharacterized protein n=1 Tax=Aspergillus lacticoffeatus (strain CBS 101883) TaxID=1450533 RepID=UPI000D7FCDBC|nr:uncharacterized protein BO96DRAFT_250504 [Aspergillus niger CBS 101883]KAI2852300.1 hypothetical protein CBS11350_778 [Aspergillus niger]KAI2894521.1 hypothetical protein CBS63078_8768 [Aspergillus niger]KAI2896608.1 hypothetical protein CBS11852_4211 [Aspergillus niger]KAI2944789.1 hypothetical protein CBS147322_7937 [Aspergillus niger]KAI2956680.1 hypothetical protein CBS147323_9185 [Aspergillus niger]